VVAQRVVDKLGLHMSPAELAAKIDVANVPPKTSLIDIEATDDSPGRARQIADTVASEFITYAASIETPTGEDSHKVRTTVVTDATAARENRLEPVLLGVLAAVAALLLGAVSVWIRAARKREVPALATDFEDPAVQEDTDTVDTVVEAKEVVEATDRG
jgi:capsular polysaccharide biosynthesis protein